VLGEKLVDIPVKDLSIAAVLEGNKLGTMAAAVYPSAQHLSPVYK
jgi:hypothetical protein